MTMNGFDQVRQFFSGTKKDAASKPPFLLSVRSSSFFIILTVCLAIFTDIFYYGLIVPVVPFSLTIQVGLPDEQVQHWTAILLACYSVALLVGSPVAGLYADRTSSRRGPLLIGLFALAGSTLLLCLGRTLWLLVLGRILQGFSAAIVWSVGCALLVDTMESAVGLAMGYVSVAMSVGLLIAPVLGGAVYAAAGYYAVYYIAFGVILMDILLRLLMIEKKIARQWIKEETSVPSPDSRNPDPEKAVAGTSSGDRKVVQGPSDGHPEDTATSPSVARSNSQGSHKKLQPTLLLLKSPRLLASLYGIVVQAGVMMGFDAVLALFLRDTFAWSSTAAGIMFLALFIPGFIAPVVGWLSDRYGAKWPSLAGFVATVPLLVCLRFITDNNIGQKVSLAVILTFLGTALAFSNTPLMAEISYAIEDISARHPGVFGERGIYGLGYGLFTCAFALGGTVGPLWAGYVVAGAGWGTMTWSLALWTASGAVVIFFWLGKSEKKKETPRNVTE